MDIVEFWMVTELELFEYGCLRLLDFCLWDWIKNKVKKNRKEYRWGELLARILDAASRIKVREDQLRLTTRDRRTRIAKCVDFGGGIFENLFYTIINLSFLYNKFVIYTLN